eukprot:6453100-Lingulodinium_polyedra.AAC.1
MISFDGGAREELGCRVAAGATIAWERSATGWRRRAARTWVIPEGATSGEADCWAAKMALDLLELAELPPGPVTI